MDLNVSTKSICTAMSHLRHSIDFIYIFVKPNVLEIYRKISAYLLCTHETGGHGGTREKVGKASLLLSLCSTAAVHVCRRESDPGLDLEDPGESKAPKVKP